MFMPIVGLVVKIVYTHALKNKHKFVQKVAKKNILLKQAQTG